MELRKFRHDYGAHLTAIYNISRDENAAKTEQYVHGLLDKQETVEYVDTGNIIGDAVINKYYRLCHLGGFEDGGHGEPLIKICRQMRRTFA